MDIEIGKHYTYEEGNYLYIKEVLVTERRLRNSWLEFDLKVIDSAGQSTFKKGATLTVGKDLSIPAYMSGNMIFKEL